MVVRPNVAQAVQPVIPIAAMPNSPVSHSLWCLAASPPRLDVYRNFLQFPFDLAELLCYNLVQRVVAG